MLLNDIADREERTDGSGGFTAGVCPDVSTAHAEGDENLSYDYMVPGRIDSVLDELLSIARFSAFDVVSAVLSFLPICGSTH